MPDEERFVSGAPSPNRQVREQGNATKLSASQRQIPSVESDSTFGPLAARAGISVPRRKPMPARSIRRCA